MENWTDYQLAKHCVTNIGKSTADEAFKVLSTRYDTLIRKGAKRIRTQSPNMQRDYETAYSDALYAFYKTIYKKFDPKKVKDIVRYTPVPRFENAISDIVRDYWLQVRAKKRGGIGFKATDEEVIADGSRNKTRQVQEYYKDKQTNFSKILECTSFVNDFIAILTEQERAMLDGIFDISDSEFKDLFQIQCRHGSSIRRSMREKYTRLHKEYWGSV